MKKQRRRLKKKKRKLYHIVYHNKEDLMEDVMCLIEIQVELAKKRGAHYTQGSIECPKCKKILHYTWRTFDGINKIECSGKCLSWKKRKLLHIKESTGGILIQ